MSWFLVSEVTRQRRIARPRRLGSRASTRPSTQESANTSSLLVLRFLITAADDAHCESFRRDLGPGWIQVKSEELSPRALLAALRAGRRAGTNVFWY